MTASRSRRTLTALLIVAAALLFSGCLLMENRELRLRVAPDGSGSGTMVYANLVSADEDGEDVAADDFEALHDYFAGPEEFEREYAGTVVTGMRLFERDSQLWGEITFTFDSLEAFGLTRTGNCDTCGIFYRRSERPVGHFTDPEAVVETNGERADAPDADVLVRWPADTGEIYLKTGLEDVDFTTTRSLLPLWKNRRK